MADFTPVSTGEGKAVLFMLLTPSNSGNLAAGAGLGIFAWGAFLKADKIPFLKKFLTTRRKEVTLGWMNRNKGMSLLGLETVNFGIHGITNPNSVMFALGNTVLNVFMLWVFLPFRMARAEKDHVQTILKGRAA
jgi:hypothetical protein